MKVETIQIQNFRSIECTSLTDCGGFNVLIGKNNAGKSNILLAINLFFESIRSGQPIQIQPKLTSSFDHYNARPRSPIEITLDFNLEEAERAELIAEIIACAPHVKNTVETIATDIRLAATIAFVSDPQPYTYVKKLALHRPGPTGTCTLDSDARTLLSINENASQELAGRARQAYLKDQDAIIARDMADRLDRIGDWDRVKNEGARLFRMTLFESSTGSQISSESMRKVDQLVRSSESKSAFREAIDVFCRSLTQEANVLRSQPLETRVETISGNEDEIPQYATNLIGRISSIKTLFLKERREPIGAREASYLLDLKVTRGGPEKLRAIQETVEALLGVEIDAFKAPGKSDAAAELDVDKFIVQVNGAGIREALRLILDYEFSQPHILLVEEPEVHLHPALETSMMRYLKRTGRECQIFITTHSTNFLDTAEMRNVYLASKGKSTNVQLLNLAEAEDAIPRELGIRLSSLFMFDKLVFVEGPSDEDVIREWASLLGINLAQASVGFVPMGGVRNLAQFAADRTITFLTKRRVLLWFLLDRDERGSEDIERLKKQLGEQAILSVLKKREIENYLIVPRALTEFIKFKQSLLGSGEKKPCSEQLVSEAIQTCADNLKTVALERRVAQWACKPLYLDRESLLDQSNGAAIEVRLKAALEDVGEKIAEKIGSIQSAIQTETAKLDQNWASEKTSILPGDQLIDEVCKQFGVRFHKDKDSVRLAALLKPGEIHPDIIETCIID